MQVGSVVVYAAGQWDHGPTRGTPASLVQLRGNGKLVLVL